VDKENKVLELLNVTYYYQTGEQRLTILEDACFAFERGKLYTIVGPSGCGKTTTLTLAGALENPKSGEILFHGKPLQEVGYTKYRSDKIGIVFQAYNLLPYLTPLQNLLVAMEITSNPIKDKKAYGKKLLGRMGISEDQMKRRIQKLSGGEQQRIAIARAIAADPEIILADEPTGNLDHETAGEIIAIFKELAHKDGKCVIAVTHSLFFAGEADVVVQLENKKLLPQEGQL